MMNRVLDIGYCLSVPEKSDGCFIIKQILGKGASSVTYLAECNQTEHVIKECNPLGLHMHREDNGALVSNTELNKVKFEEYLSRFVEGANKQLAFRLTDGLKNTTSNVQAIYRANNTVYIDMTFFKGSTYDKVEDESLHHLLRRIKALTQVVGHYHDMGYLYLDIKPQNVYTIPETPEMVMMFDFDSVTLKNDEKALLSSSYTDIWAAPEQKMQKYRDQICEATDLFAIGEILFYKIFGRHSKDDSRFSFSGYEYDNENDMLKNANPKVFSILTEIFHHTICNVASQRYQKAQELIEKLDEIIKFADPQKYFLKTSLPSISDFFIGRNYEIERIHNKLQQNDVLFLSGIGGIGKSELAKHYANEYKNEYDAIIFAPFVSDIQMMIIDDNAVPIYNFSQYPEEKSHEYFERKLRELGKLCNERTLIIVDNLNITEDSNLDKLLKLGCKMLITTRVDFAGFNQSQIKIDKLNNKADIRKIFDKYYNCQSNDESTCVDEIIELVDGHTLAVELIAKQIEAEWATADEILEKLKTTGVYGIGDAMVDSGKDNKFSVKSAYNHIKSLFDLSAFNKNADALYILTNLALIPYTGIDKKLFAKWCELDKHGGKTNFDNLVKSGWIKSNGENGFVSLHPLIADIILEELDKDISLCETMLKHITELFIDGSFENYDSSVRSKLFDMNSTICDRIYRFCNLSEICIDFINATVMNFYLYGYINEYIDYMIKAIEASESFITFPKEKIAKYYNTLGMLYLYNDKFAEAEDCFNNSLSMKKELYIKGHSEIAISLNDIGLLYYNQGIFNVAKQYLEDALKIRIDISDNNEDIAQSYNNMGVIYASLEDTVKAEENYNNAKKLYMELGEEKHSDSVVTYSNLGSLYIKHGEYDKAEKTLIHAHKLCEKIHGNEHRNTAIVLQALGALYSKTKKYENAEIHYKKALEISLELYGEYHSYTANIYNSIAVLYKKLHRIKEATNYYSKVRKIYLNVYGENHPNTASIYSNLGGLALSCKDFKNAEILYSRAKNIWFDVYNGNKNHKNIATIYENLGVLHERQGDNEKAIEHFKEALNIKKRIFDIAHPDIKILEDKIKILKQN